MHVKCTSTNAGIKTYIRVFPSSGIDPILDNQFQILDGNTILNKAKISTNSNRIKMHSFNYVFTNQFQNSTQIQYIDLADQCFEGKNQIIIAQITKEFVQSFMLGTPEDPGFIISAFQGIFQQIYHHVPSAQQKVINNGKKVEQKQFCTKKQQSISISIFSSEGSSNKFIDLILGQKFTFYSKKDMDEYKDFYDKEIDSMRQFLICLKLALLRYRECCKQGDPIVFRVIVDNYDEIKCLNYSSYLHIVICQAQSKIVRSISKKIELSLTTSHLRGEDHGSLANYLERYLKKSKLIYIYGIPFRKSVLQNCQKIFSFLGQLKHKSIEISSSVIDSKLENQVQKINRYTLPKSKLKSNYFTHKQINLSISLLQKTCIFLDQVQKKWKNYCQVFKQMLQMQKDFYEQERFPISLQIQEYNVKSFMISKFYRLCQIFQMDDLTSYMQKLRTLKNQVSIQLKALLNSKQFISLSNNPNTIDFVRYYSTCTEQISANIKTLFGFRYRCTEIYNLNISEHINIESVMDCKVFRQLIVKFKNEATKVKQKEDILLRKIDIGYQQNKEERKIKDQTKSVEHKNKQGFPKQHNIRQSQIFDLFQKERRMKNNQRSRILQNESQIIVKRDSSYKKNQNYNIQIKKQINYGRNFLTNRRKNINSGIYSQKLDSSILVYRQGEQEKQNYNFALPKLAIIHHKKTKR